MPELSDLYRSLMNDPDIVPPENVDKEAYVLNMAQQRLRQFHNNEQALELGYNNSAVSKLAMFVSGSPEASPEMFLQKAVDRYKEMNITTEALRKLQELGYSRENIEGLVRNKSERRGGSYEDRIYKISDTDGLERRSDEAILDAINSITTDGKPFVAPSEAKGYDEQYRPIVIGPKVVDAQGREKALLYGTYTDEDFNDIIEARSGSDTPTRPKLSDADRKNFYTSLTYLNNDKLYENTAGYLVQAYNDSIRAENRDINMGLLQLHLDTIHSRGSFKERETNRIENGAFSEGWSEEVLNEIGKHIDFRDDDLTAANAEAKAKEFLTDKMLTPSSIQVTGAPSNISDYRKAISGQPLESGTVTTTDDDDDYVRTLREKKGWTDAEIVHWHNFLPEAKNIIEDRLTNPDTIDNDLSFTDANDLLNTAVELYDDDVDAPIGISAKYVEGYDPSSSPQGQTEGAPTEAPLIIATPIDDFVTPEAKKAFQEAFNSLDSDDERDAFTSHLQELSEEGTKKVGVGGRGRTNVTAALQRATNPEASASVVDESADAQVVEEVGSDDASSEIDMVLDDFISPRTSVPVKAAWQAALDRGDLTIENIRDKFYSEGNKVNGEPQLLTGGARQTNINALIQEVAKLEEASSTDLALETYEDIQDLTAEEIEAALISSGGYTAEDFAEIKNRPNVQTINADDESEFDREKYKVHLQEQLATVREIALPDEPISGDDESVDLGVQADKLVIDKIVRTREFALELLNSELGDQRITSDEIRAFHGGRTKPSKIDRRSFGTLKHSVSTARTAATEQPAEQPAGQTAEGGGAVEQPVEAGGAVEQPAEGGEQVTQDGGAAEPPAEAGGAVGSRPRIVPEGTPATNTELRDFQLEVQALYTAAGDLGIDALRQDLGASADPTALSDRERTGFARAGHLSFLNPSENRSVEYIRAEVDKLKASEKEGAERIITRNRNPDSSIKVELNTAAQTGEDILQNIPVTTKVKGKTIQEEPAVEFGGYRKSVYERLLDMSILNEQGEPTEMGAAVLEAFGAAEPNVREKFDEVRIAMANDLKRVFTDNNGKEHYSTRTNPSAKWSLASLVNMFNRLNSKTGITLLPPDQLPEGTVNTFDAQVEDLDMAHEIRNTLLQSAFGRKIQQSLTSLDTSGVELTPAQEAFKAIASDLVKTTSNFTDIKAFTNHVPSIGGLTSNTIIAEEARVQDNLQGGVEGQDSRSDGDTSGDPSGDPRSRPTVVESITSTDELGTEDDTLEEDDTAEKTSQQKRIDKADKLGLLDHILENASLSVDADTIEELKAELASMELSKLDKLFEKHGKTFKVKTSQQTEGVEGTGETAKEPSTFNRREALEHLIRLDHPDVDAGSPEFEDLVNNLDNAPIFNEEFYGEDAVKSKILQRLDAAWNANQNTAKQDRTKEEKRVSLIGEHTAKNDFEINFPTPDIEKMSPEEARLQMRRLLNFNHREDIRPYSTDETKESREFAKQMLERFSQYAEKAGKEAVNELAQDIKDAKYDYPRVELGSEDFLTRLEKRDQQKVQDAQLEVDKAENIRDRLAKVLERRPHQGVRGGQHHVPGQEPRTLAEGEHHEEAELRQRLNAEVEAGTITQDEANAQIVALWDKHPIDQIHVFDSEGNVDPKIQELVSAYHEARKAVGIDNDALQAQHVKMDASQRRIRDGHARQVELNNGLKWDAHEELDTEEDTLLSKIEEAQRYLESGEEEDNLEAEILEQNNVGEMQLNRLDSDGIISRDPPETGVPITEDKAKRFERKIDIKWANLGDDLKPIYGVKANGEEDNITEQLKVFRANVLEELKQRNIKEVQDSPYNDDLSHEENTFNLEYLMAVHINSEKSVAHRIDEMGESIREEAAKHEVGRQEYISTIKADVEAAITKLRDDYVQEFSAVQADIGGARAEIKDIDQRREGIGIEHASEEERLNSTRDEALKVLDEDRLQSEQVDLLAEGSGQAVADARKALVDHVGGGPEGEAQVDGIAAKLPDMGGNTQDVQAKNRLGDMSPDAQDGLDTEGGPKKGDRQQVPDPENPGKTKTQIFFPGQGKGWLDEETYNAQINNFKNAHDAEIPQMTLIPENSMGEHGNMAIWGEEGQHHLGIGDQAPDTNVMNDNDFLQSLAWEQLNHPDHVQQLEDFGDGKSVQIRNPFIDDKDLVKPQDVAQSSDSQASPVRNYAGAQEYANRLRSLRHQQFPGRFKPQEKGQADLGTELWEVGGKVGKGVAGLAMHVAGYGDKVKDLKRSTSQTRAAEQLDVDEQRFMAAEETALNQLRHKYKMPGATKEELIGPE